MTISAADIKKLSPKFKNETKFRIDLFLGMAQRCISESAWGDKYQDGVCLLTAHYLASSQCELADQQEDTDVCSDDDSGDSSSSTSTTTTTAAAAEVQTFISKKKIGDAEYTYSVVPSSSSTSSTSSSSGSSSTSNTSTPSADDLCSTFWGKLFLELKATIPCLPLAASSCLR